jgi:hypothetical protein
MIQVLVQVSGHLLQRIKRKKRETKTTKNKVRRILRIHCLVLIQVLVQVSGHLLQRSKRRKRVTKIPKRETIIRVRPRSLLPSAVPTLKPSTTKSQKEKKNTTIPQTIKKKHSSYFVCLTNNALIVDADRLSDRL